MVNVVFLCALGGTVFINIDPHGGRGELLCYRARPTKADLAKMAFLGLKGWKTGKIGENSLKRHNSWTMSACLAGGGL